MPVQAQKVYVQDRLRESGGLVWKLLEDGGHFYVCGGCCAHGWVCRTRSAADHRVPSGVSGSLSSFPVNLLRKCASMSEAFECCSLIVGFPPRLPHDRSRILANASHGCQNSVCCSVRAQLNALLPHIWSPLLSQDISAV